MSQAKLDITKFQGSFTLIPKHDLRKLILYSRAHPEDLPLKHCLTRGLWDLEQYKDIYELLPPISTTSLRVSLELHSKILFRMALSDSSAIKRLIPIAISYAASLGQDQRNSILELLEGLIEVRNDDSLKQYFKLHIDLEKVDSESRKLSPKGLKTEFFLSPELAYKLKINHEFINLQKTHSKYGKWYYLEGGHFILLAECRYFSEVDSRNRAVISKEVNCMIDFVRYAGGPSKEFIAHMQSAVDLVVSNHELQGFLMIVLHDSVMAECSINSDQEFKTFLKGKAELHLFLNDVCARISTPAEELRFALCLSLSNTARLMRERNWQFKDVKDIFVKGLEVVFGFRKSFKDKGVKLAFQEIEKFFSDGYIQCLCRLSESQELIFWLTQSKNAKENKGYFITAVDHFVDHLDSDDYCLPHYEVTAQTMKAGLLSLKGQTVRLKRLQKSLDNLHW